VALPDSHRDEPTVELDHELYRLYREAAQNADAWDKIAKRYQQQIRDAMTDYFAATVDGRKVLTYRPSKKYAESRLQADYPDLTQHYSHTVTKDVFDIDLFSKAHPEIADKYVVRSLREVEE